jgi:type I restriction enzyme S subunit
MPAEWKRCLLGDVLTLQRGFDITKKEQKQGTVPVISSSGINSYHNVAKVKGPGVIIGRKGSLGTTFYVKEDYWPHDTTLWVKDFHGNSPKFTYYFLGTLNLANFDVGAANPSLNRNHVHLLPVYWPPVFIQHTIADILSAYDDLIENNARCIAILEEMARSLYHEWFVKFRFPGYENVKMVESEMGLIPEGWEIKPVSSAVYINPSTHISRVDEKPFVPMSSLSNNSMLIENIELREGNSGSKFKNGDTLFARITPCIENGKIGYVQFLPSADATAFGSTEFIVLRSKTLCPEYVYLMARTDDLRDHAMKSMSGATGRQRVQVSCFDTFFIAQPDPFVLAKFQALVSPIFQNIHALAQRNARLRRARDLLLPKLISGEIDVSGWAGGGVYEEMAESLVGGPGARRVAETRPDVGAITPIDKDALQWRSLWEEE